VAAGTAQNSIVGSIPGNQVSQGRVQDKINFIKGSFGSNDFGSDSWLFEQIDVYSSKQFLVSKLAQALQ